ncbi:hypothetical protein BABINDRAFT_159693 [Babjeviella inositovora NRRL Y-12698]|uniref:FAD-binding domain-containing protein n=1 Tax=Babjeviella inositovora NRRL Y-12698 TaxID=984486 RepID=A0A1E3R025_9ASCO|nr:uncharacterized protein BABINDRAFT_159693 [Babjeviella inositovora NRRL Y-12698]ODQ83258.1 hypothetical protein BABINDRAFT_159693 [Babjeviella inositovora NRRL Y-12698]
MTTSQDSKIVKTSLPLTFTVVGAGLGGVAAAIGLTLAGHKVTVLEQAIELGEVGAGIQIPPNSSIILDQFGVKEAIAKVSTLPEKLRFFNWKGTKTLSTQDLYPYTVEKYGGEYFHIHRADFHRILVTRARELGVEIILGCHIDKVDFETNTCYTPDGRSFTSDVVIAADGLKSKIRSLILNKDDPAHDTGDLAYRALIKVSEMRKYKELKFIYEKPNITFFWGPDIHIVIYLLQGGETCNVVVLSPDTLPAGVNVQNALDTELPEMFKDWDPRLKSLWALVHETSKWRLQNSREMDTWVHDTANIALMGDACHATLPYLAQGAAQAVEDAACLTGLFGRIQKKSQIHATLQKFEELRKARTTRVVQGSTNCRNVYHCHDGPEQVKRDALCALNPPQEGCPNPWADPVFQKFLFGYDAFAEAESGWAELTAVSPSL